MLVLVSNNLSNLSFIYSKFRFFSLFLKWLVSLPSYETCFGCRQVLSSTANTAANKNRPKETRRLQTGTGKRDTSFPGFSKPGPSTVVSVRMPPMRWPMIHNLLKTSACALKGVRSNIAPVTPCF